MTEMVETEYGWKMESQVYMGHQFLDEPSEQRIISSIHLLKLPVRLRYGLRLEPKLLTKSLKI